MPWWYWTFFLGGIGGCLIWQQPIFEWTGTNAIIFVAYGLFITASYRLGTFLAERKYNKENP